MPVMFVSDLRATYQTFDRIRAMVAAGEVAQVVPGHDSDIMNRLTMVPYGELAGLMATIGAN